MYWYNVYSYLLLGLISPQKPDQYFWKSSTTLWSPSFRKKGGQKIWDKKIKRHLLDAFTQVKRIYFRQMYYFITNFLSSFLICIYSGQKFATNARNFLLWFLCCKWHISWMITYLIYLVGRWIRSRFREIFWSWVQLPRLDFVFLTISFL